MPASSDPPPPLSGLSETAAAARLQRDGFNELPSAKPRSIIAIALEVVREPMFLLLIASGVIYLLLGDPAEAAALLAAVFLVIGITLYQEQKTERALEALRDLSSPRALVVRDGVTRRIAGRDVVQGDIVILREGDRVPADARIETCRNLFVDESLLTGESVAVRKMPAETDVAAGSPGGDDRPFAYSGTLVVRGDGNTSFGTSNAWRAEACACWASLRRSGTPSPCPTLLKAFAYHYLGLHGIDHRPGVLGCVRNGAGGTRRHAASTAQSTRPSVHAYSRRPQRVAGDRCARGCGARVRGQHAVRPDRDGRPDADVHDAHRHQPAADRHQSVADPPDAGRLVDAEPRAAVAGRRVHSPSSRRSSTCRSSAICSGCRGRTSRMRWSSWWPAQAPCYGWK